MNGGSGPAPTRSNLLRARARLERVRKGTELLTRKRRALVSELLDLAEPAADARARVAERAVSAYASLLRALAADGAPGLRTTGRPARRIDVEIRERKTWGVDVAEISSRTPVARSVPARQTSPGSAGPGGVQAAEEFEALVELLLDAASREMHIRRLAGALARTSRQVRALERRVGPDLEARIERMSRVLDEREREEHTRLKRLLSRRRADRPS